MCGIAGFLNIENKINHPDAIIHSMIDHLHHRGPNDHGVWLDEDAGVALGHRRLSIHDLSAGGHQPMVSHNERYVIVYNGEVYNFKALRQTLINKNHLFKSDSDTEVILAAITEYGIQEALQQMLGMFAFALWDRETRTLTLARDRIGEKPLYYGHFHGNLVFASELKVLHCYPQFKPIVSQQSLQLYLQYGYIPSPHSIYESVFKLPAGSYLTITDKNVSQTLTPRYYWSYIDVAKQGINEPLILSDAEAIFQTKAKLEHIVASRMDSDVPSGAFLSGGIDSSLITALMQANSSSPIPSFTLGFDSSDYNEAPFAKKIAEYLGTDHSELYINQTDALSVIPKLPHIYDEPFADSSAIPTLLISELARKKVTVCLSGDGGDEIFGGYNRYLLASSLWKKVQYLPYPLRLLLRKCIFTLSPSAWQQLLKCLKLPMIGDKLYKFADSVCVKQPEILYQKLISQWHAPQQILQGAAIGASPNALYSTLETMDFIEKMMVMDTLSYLPDDIMVKLDRASMAVGLESRAPYLDHDLITFIWQLPLHMKIRNRTTKWLLRQVLKQYIPESLFTRPKMGFAIPLDHWLRGPLQDWAHHLLDPIRLKEEGFFKPELITQRWQEHLSGKRNWQYPLWTILMFQAWQAHA